MNVIVVLKLSDVAEGILAEQMTESKEIGVIASVYLVSVSVQFLRPWEYNSL